MKPEKRTATITTIQDGKPVEVNVPVTIHYAKREDGTTDATISVPKIQLKNKKRGKNG